MLKRKWNNNGQVAVIVFSLLLLLMITALMIHFFGLGSFANPYGFSEFQQKISNEEFTAGSIIWTEGIVTTINPELTPPWVAIDGINVESWLGNISNLKVGDNIFIRVQIIEEIGKLGVIILTSRALHWEVH